MFKNILSYASPTSTICGFGSCFSGGFTAPQSGVYLLSVYATSGDSLGNPGPVLIKKNDEVLCTMRITGGNSGSDACPAITELTPEDSVRVTGSANEPAFIFAARGAGFVGHMIQPYC